MKHLANVTRGKGFKVLLDGGSSQAALMVLQPGDSSSDEPEDEHPKAEQWVYVVSGSGRARTKERRLSLNPGSLLLIEKDEPHQITATGKEPLVTINFYAPAAYTKDADVKRSVRR